MRLHGKDEALWRKTLERRLGTLERSGRVQVPVLSSDPDPDDLEDGDLWISGGVLKIRISGITKTITTT